MVKTLAKIDLNKWQSDNVIALLRSFCFVVCSRRQILSIGSLFVPDKGNNDNNSTTASGALRGSHVVHSLMPAFGYLFEPNPL